MHDDDVKQGQIVAMTISSAVALITLAIMCWCDGDVGEAWFAVPSAVTIFATSTIAIMGIGS